MTWIKSPVTLLNNLQMALLAQALEVPLTKAIGHLHTIFWWCLEHAADGHLETRDPRVLASAGLWEGDPEIFVRALVQTGWIAPTEKGFQICRWEDYAGPVLKNRQRQARYRTALREPIFRRDGYRCRYCGRTDHLTIDHVIPLSRGGTNRPENLVTACRYCNSQKSARTPEEWGWKPHNQPYPNNRSGEAPWLTAS
jgi:hypothetical protein